MIKELLEIAKKEGIQLEIYKEQDLGVSIEGNNDFIEMYETCNIINYNLKALYKNKTININTENISDFENIITLIKKQASIIEKNDENRICDNIDKIKVENLKDSNDYKKIKKDIIKLYENKKLYSNIVSINTSVSTSIKNIGIYNTNGVELEDSNTYVFYLIELVMDFKGINKTNYRYFYTKEYNSQKLFNEFDKLVEMTIEKENTNSLKTGKYDIVLDNKCVANLLEHFSFMFLAENINKGKSLLNDKFEKKIFNEKINIVEDPKNEELIGKRNFDDEGTETNFKKIIDKGIFVTKLYNNETALKESRESTGNSYGVRNMYLVPGETKKVNLINKLSNGVYITNIEGLHAGINDTTGDISLQAEGYKIENGKKCEFLNMIILSSNIFELFNNVIEIANDLEFVSVNSGAPSILIKDILVAGNK